MSSKIRRFLAVLSLVALARFFTLDLLVPAEAAERMCELAKPSPRPVGAPAASDVIMRSLSLHPRNDQDPHDTMQALGDFHATTLAWAYITDPGFIARVKSTGRVFGGAVAAPSYYGDGKKEDWFEDVVIVNVKGEPIIAPWKRAWNRTLWGCVNNPELERGYIEYLKRYIDSGAQIMQRDEPGANLNATHWGGCFCRYCMKGFRGYLAAHTSATQRLDLGIGDIQTFDYGEHLRATGAPVGDAFGTWNGGELKDLFVDYQTEATVEFHERTRKALDKYAGRHVPVSCNNGARRWGEIQLGFDWAFGELAYSHATAHYLYQAMWEATQHRRKQIVTMPKKGNTDDPVEWERRTRQTIAMAYACGGHCMVPWDVYMPHNAPRYFGKPEQYADLFGFIQANARFFDGFEEATATGHGVPKRGQDVAQAVRIVGGGKVSAVVRAVPGERDSAVVVHLVDWSESSKPFTLNVNPTRFFGNQPLKIRLLRPKPYAKHVHDRAEAQRDYQTLSEAVPLAQGHIASVRIPPLDPWGIVVIEADANGQGGVWQVGIWAEEDSCYSNRLVVRMDCASADVAIRYTLDGSEPGHDSQPYTTPLHVVQTATIKAAAFTQTGASSVAEATFTKIEGVPAPLQPDAATLAPALKLWLKADTLEAALDGSDVVQRWVAAAGPDALVQLGKLRDGAPPAAPTFVNDAIHGRPVIRFDGVDDQLAVQGFANDYLVSTAFTIVMVTRSSMPGFGICGNSLNGSGGLPRLYLTRNTFRYDVLDRGLAPHVPDQSPAISTFTHDGQETIAAYVDGESKGRQSGLPTVSAFGGGHLAMPFWGGNENHAGDIAEIIVFDRDLTDDERQGVELYLAAKYRIKVRRHWR